MRARGVEVDDYFLVREGKGLEGDVGAVGPGAAVVGIECHCEEGRGEALAGEGFRWRKQGVKGEGRGR